MMDANNRSYVANKQSDLDQVSVIETTRDRVGYLVQRLSGNDAPNTSIQEHVSALHDEYARYAEVLQQQCFNTEHVLNGLKQEYERVQIFLKSTSQLLDEKPASTGQQRASY